MTQTLSPALRRVGSTKRPRGSMKRFDPKLWDQLLDTLKQRYAPICRQWFSEDLEPGRLDGGVLEILTATAIQQNYLQKRCLEPFTEAAQAVTQQLVAVRFVCELTPAPSAETAEPDPAALEALLPPTPAPADVAVDARPTPDGDPDEAARGESGVAESGDSPRSLSSAHPEHRVVLPAPAAAPAAPSRTTASLSAREALPDSVGDVDADSMVLSPDYSFDNFITGPNNQLAGAAAVAVANQPGTTYNPLFIHGGVGLGKTHLLQSICQSILTRQPATRILYVSCDAFMNQFIACVKAGKMSQFRHHYRDVDLLVIDDIHFLANRERSQEEFFHTFNELYQSNRQIVLSSDAAPSEIPNLEERLVSRFNWGLVAHVSKPGYETRVAILQAKAALRGFKVPAEVIDLVARKVDSNARELEGAIVNLQGYAQLMEREVDMALAREALGEPAMPAQANRATLQHIVDVVTRYYDVKLIDLQSRRRHKSIVEPRQVCMWLAQTHPVQPRGDRRLLRRPGPHHRHALHRGRRKPHEQRRRLHAAGQHHARRAGPRHRPGVLTLPPPPPHPPFAPRPDTFSPRTHSTVPRASSRSLSYPGRPAFRLRWQTGVGGGRRRG